MKKLIFVSCVIVVLAVAGIFTVNYISAQNINKGIVSDSGITQVKDNDFFPEFYRGIYLTVDSANKLAKLQTFVEMAKAAKINCFVIDVQSAKYAKCIVPAENVQYCKDNGIHPIARVVMFPDGLKNWPVSAEYIQERLDVAESACKNGFKEIQFDYIRFNDSSRNKALKNADRYAFIEGFISRAREQLKKYNVKIAVDVFGRIPLNVHDQIGQRMESLDKVADIICPMAYPSHYTWSKKLMKDPYYTVFITSKKAKERVKNAQIVSYIQAFKMKLYDMPYDKYIAEQIRAVHESEIRGYLMWNARQDYTVPLAVVKDFYSRNSKLLK
ncbi:MAG TPA: putative glycoside hydrolase [Spirochaetota bacterium]|nr:putative glycoside hydrolase [Spirochaetota bacterium]